MEKTTTMTSFDTLDLGSVQPTSVPMETVDVEINYNEIIGNFGKAFVQEGHRVAPLRAEQINLTKEEMDDYIKFLIDQRVRSVDLNCPDWRKLKALYIPAWIQYCLSMIGEVNLRDRGLKIHPTFHEQTITFEEAYAISEKIGSFINDLQIVRDAMPRGIEGNKDVMSTALIAGYVRSLGKVEHVSATYVTAFLGMKLREEAAMQAIYRVQYDDVAFIATALTTQKGLY